MKSLVNKKSDVIVLCFLGLLLITSCGKSLNVLETEGYLYNSAATLRSDSYLERRSEGDVSCFHFQSGRLLTEATEDLYWYNAEFVVIIKDSAFVGGAKIPLSANDFQQKWYVRYPRGFENIEKTEASLCLHRTWSVGAVAKSYMATFYEKNFYAIDGWVRIVCYSKHYGAEYECRVVAESDGEVLNLHGEYRLQEDR